LDFIKLRMRYLTGYGEQAKQQRPFLEKAVE
jgi:hypothetical protein